MGCNQISVWRLKRTNLIWMEDCGCTAISRQQQTTRACMCVVLPPCCVCVRVLTIGHTDAGEEFVLFPTLPVGSSWMARQHVIAVCGDVSSHILRLLVSSIRILSGFLSVSWCLCEEICIPPSLYTFELGEILEFFAAVRNFVMPILNW